MRGRAVSIMTAVIFLAQFLAPIVTQPMVQSAGIVSIFGYAAGLSFLLSLILAGAALRES